MAFMPSGIITLTTDFGHKGVFAGTMKGSMLLRFPEARIVDLTHDTLAHWPDEAGFWLARAHRYFPPGTVHVAVVDPGVGTARDIVAVSVGEQLFLAPDNGLLGQVVAQGKPLSIHRLDFARLSEFGIESPSATFHGRDIFAPLAAAFASGELEPAAIGPLIDEIIPALLDAPRIEDDSVSGIIVTSDHFGNLISNIDQRDIARLRQPYIETGGWRFDLVATYGDVEPGEFLALVNSFGVIEIACAERSAADRLGIGRGAPVVVRNRG